GDPVLGRAGRVEELELAPDWGKRRIKLHRHQGRRGDAVQVTVAAGQGRGHGTIRIATETNQSIKPFPVLIPPFDLSPSTNRSLRRSLEVTPHSDHLLLAVRAREWPCGNAFVPIRRQIG